MMPSTTAANLSSDSSNVLPPLSPSSSPTQSQVQNVQVQAQQAAANRLAQPSQNEKVCRKIFCYKCEIVYF